MFQLKDYESAVKYYAKSLDYLQKKYNSPLEIGSRVLVIPQSTAQSLKMRVGIISADIANNEEIEVMFDDEVTHSLTHSLTHLLTHVLTNSLTRERRMKKFVTSRMSSQ